MQKNNIYNFGFIILGFIFFNIIITSIFFIFNIRISNINFILSCFLTIIFSYFIFRKDKYNIKKILLNTILLIILITSSIFAMGKIYDSSYDGNNYHKVAIGEIKNGWNPVFQDIDKFNINKKNNIILNDTSSIWTNHYAKGYYMYAANVYSVTGNIECGKSFNVLLGLSLFFILLSFLLTKFSKTFSIIISILITCNPIFTAQLFLFYNDLNVASLLFLLLVTLTIIIDVKNKFKFKFILLFMILSILINIKFSAFGYAGIYSLMFFIYICFNKKQRKINFKKIMICGILSLLVGIFIIGLSTYVKNTINYKQPFYPLVGKNKQDIIINQIPEDFYKYNRFKKFFVANFSESINISKNSTEKIKYKIPLTTTKKELRELGTYDLRMGGYGVLFGGILILALLIISYYLVFKIKDKRYKFINTTTLLYFVGTIILICIVSDTWWARYFPQLYLIPFIALFYLKLDKLKITKFIKFLIIILLIININFSSYIMFYKTISRNKIITNNINNYKKDYIIDTKKFNGIIYNFYDNHGNIEYNKNIKINDNYEKVGSAYWFFADYYKKIK